MTDTATRSEVDELRTEMNERFNALDKRLEDHGERLESLEVGQQGLEEAVKENSRKVDLLLDHFGIAP